MTRDITWNEEISAISPLSHPRSDFIASGFNYPFELRFVTRVGQALFPFERSLPFHSISTVFLSPDHDWAWEISSCLVSECKLGIYYDRLSWLDSFIPLYPPLLSFRDYWDGVSFISGFSTGMSSTFPPPSIYDFHPFDPNYMPAAIRNLATMLPGDYQEQILFRFSKILRYVQDW